MSLTPKCYTRKCIHYLGFKNEGVRLTGKVYCKAFPNKIPDRIAYGEDEHSIKANDQENDIIYEKRDMERVNRIFKRTLPL